MSADLHLTQGLPMGRMCVSAAGAARSRVMLRLLGMVALLGLLSACSTPKQEEVVADRKMKERFGRYHDEVFGRLRDTWKLYKAQSPNDRATGSVRVSFYLGTTGKVEQIHVKNNQDTDPALTKFTVKAIQDAKFPPLPPELIPWVKKMNGEGLGFDLAFNMDKQTRRGPLMSAKEKQQMEKRWGMPPGARGGRASRSGVDEVSVSLTSNESGARQAPKPPPASPSTKGGGASGGKSTTVKLTQTPKERYCRLVNQAVEKKWNKYRQMEMAGITYGSLDVSFYVNKSGKVEEVRVANDTQSYRALTLFTLRAIQDAEIPPMPAAVIPLLPMNHPERLKIEYHVLIY